MLAIGFWGVFGLVLLLLVIGAAVWLALNYRKVGPNEVLIVSGGVRQRVTEPDGTVRMLGYRMRIGGGAFVIPLFQTAQVLPLDSGVRRNDGGRRSSKWIGDGTKPSSLRTP